MSPEIKALQKLYDKIKAETWTIEEGKHSKRSILTGLAMAIDRLAYLDAQKKVDGTHNEVKIELTISEEHKKLTRQLEMLQLHMARYLTALYGDNWTHRPKDHYSFVHVRWMMAVLNGEDAEANELIRYVEQNHNVRVK